MILKIKFSRLIFSPVIIFCFIFSCGQPVDITSFQSSEDVDQRFHESMDGETKALYVSAPKNPVHFSFIWATDMHFSVGKDDYMRELGNYVRANPADFMITSGDLANEGKEEEYRLVLKRVDEELQIPFYSAMGNHDTYNDGWSAFKELIGPSVFSFYYGNSQFIILDSANCTLGKDQMDWFEKRLKYSDAEHIFVFSHFCVYDSTFETPTILCNPDERYMVLGLLNKYDVDFFLCGHKHSAERYEVEGTWHIQGGTGSAWNLPINDDPQFYRFDIDGPNVSFDQIYFKDLD